MAQQQPQKRFLKGLFKDTAHIDQPEGTWRYAKNAIINEKKVLLLMKEEMHQMEIFLQDLLL